MRQVFTVSQINSYIHRIFDSDYALRKINLKGEVSNCKYHSSGHIYFTLKDEKSALRCVMFLSDRAEGLHFRLEDGQLVLVRGNISVYEREGSYQLYAREIELAGAGELYIQYERRKEELAKKGYFDFERKKTLPPFPEKIGIVTALTGAAIEDIKSIAARRNPYVQLYLYPAKVQGEGAAKTIADGIRFFDHEDVDIIIIGRGGGSIEDLWAFNELVVAESIYQAKTPIVSGTGHEIDMTIADYCADVRAATPSAACELAIPDIYGVIQMLDDYRDRLDNGMMNRVQKYRQRFLMMERFLESRHPGTKLLEQKMICQNREQRLHQSMMSRVGNLRHALNLRTEKLHGLSPTARLTGGYVFAQNQQGKPMTSVKQVKREESFSLIFSDGSVEAKALSVQENGQNQQKADRKTAR